MKIYIKQCRPFQVSFGGQGFSDTWTPLEDWQDEDNESILREKYPDELLQKKDSWSVLKFQYRYVVIGDGILGEWKGVPKEMGQFTSYLKEHAFLCDPGNGYSFYAIDTEDLDDLVEEFLSKEEDI